jgi:ABC-2 type transport system permease protein
VAALTAALCIAAVWIAGRRDVRDGVLPAGDSGPAHVLFLNSPLGLAFRLNRTLIAAWVAALAATAFIGGLVSKSSNGAAGGSMRNALGRLGVSGAESTNGAAAYLSIFFIICSAFIAVGIIGQLAAAQEEEAAGRVDHLLVRATGRVRWLAGRIAIALVTAFAMGAVTGLTAWAGAAMQHSGVGLGTLAMAGANLAFPSVFILSAGIVLYGLLPRAASAAAYALVAWSFILQLVSVGVPTSHWLLDTSVLAHLAHAPAAHPSWTAAAWLTGLGLAGFAVGIAAFTRRDLAPG